VPFLPAEKQTTTTTTTARDITEYHIHYRKRTGGLTGFPGTTPAANPILQAGGTAPAGGVVQAIHTQPQADAVPTIPVPPPGALPAPDMTGIGGR
jgi:hypothetical protein